MSKDEVESVYTSRMNFIEIGVGTLLFLLLLSTCYQTRNIPIHHQHSLLSLETMLGRLRMVSPKLNILFRKMRYALQASNAD